MPSINTFANTTTKANWVTMKGLDLLLNKLQVAPYFDTSFNENYDKEFAIGSTFVVPMSQRIITQRNNMVYSPQAMSRPTTTVVCNQTSTAALEWESVEKALDMERGDDRAYRLYIKPAIAYMRQDIDSDCAQYAYQNTNMLTGVLGTNPATFDATSAAARQFLAQMGADVDDECGLFLPPAVIRAVKGSSVTWMNPQPDIAKQQRTGMIGHADGFDFYGSNSLYTHTAGTWASAVTISGAGQSGSSLLVACTSGDTWKAGDKFSIANVNELNLMTRRTTSTATAGSKVFTIAADVTATGATATITFNPPIVGPGSQYQNVDALPAASAALTLWPGTSSPNGKSGKVGLALAGSAAFILVGVKMEIPEAVEVASQQQDPDTQIAIRFIRQWDNIQSRMTNRLDSLWGRGIALAEQCAVCIACA
jgi:hypothetical protein